MTTTSIEALMQRLAERTTERDYHMRVCDQLAERIREKDAEIKALREANQTFADHAIYGPGGMDKTP